MKTKLLLLLCLVLAVANTGSAQFRFSSDDDVEEKEFGLHKYTIKTDIVSLMTYEFPVYVEYFVHPKFSIELGAGVTHMWSYGIYEDILTLSNSNYYYKGQPAPMFGGTVKYYPFRDENESIYSGFFVGAGFFSKQFKFKIEEPEIPVVNGLIDTKSSRGFGVVLGLTVRYKHFVGEATIGLYSASFNQLQHYDSYDNNNNPYMYTLENNDTRLHRVISFKLGYAK